MMMSNNTLFYLFKLNYLLNILLNYVYYYYLIILIVYVPISTT